MITALDGEAISSSADLVAAIRSQKPGTEVTLDVDRQGSSDQATVTLGQAPQQ